MSDFNVFKSVWTLYKKLGSFFANLMQYINLSHGKLYLKVETKLIKSSVLFINYFMIVFWLENDSTEGMIECQKNTLKNSIF